MVGPCSVRTPVIAAVNFLASLTGTYSGDLAITMMAEFFPGAVIVETEYGVFDQL